MNYMRKLLLLLSALFALSAGAQTADDLQFVDAKGNVHATGSTVNISTVEEDPFVGTQMPAGLYLKNAGKQDVAVRVKFSDGVIPNGEMQVCAFTHCEMLKGTMTKEGILKAGARDNLMWEWFPTAYGTASAKVKTELVKYDTEIDDFGNEVTVFGDKIADGPTLTVNFVYADPASVNAVENAEKAKVVSRYNVAGQQLSGKSHGVVIEKLSNGKARKTVR